VTTRSDNEAITRLPVLLFTTEDNGDGWVAAPVLQSNGQRIVTRRPVRRVPPSVLEQFASPKTRASFETTYGSIRHDFTQQLLSMIGIAGAAKKNDLKQVAILAERAATPREKLAASSPWDRVAAALNTGLFRTLPVLWQKEQQLVPALLCLTPAQALFAHALFRLAGVGRCRKCGSPFFAVRSRQHYCGYRCRVAEAMRRYRRKVEKGKAGKPQRHRRATRKR